MKIDEPRVRKLLSRSRYGSPTRSWWSGHEDLRVLHIEDLSELPSAGWHAGFENYQFRGLARARAEDGYITTVTPCPRAERYRSERLGLGSPEMIRVRASPGEPLWRIAAACQRNENLRILLERLPRGQTIALHPYMASVGIERLADTLSRHGRDVAIIGPPHQLAAFVNDKSCFLELAAAVLGREEMIPWRSANSAEAVVEYLLEFSRSFAHVCVKLATGYGLRNWRAAELDRLDVGSEVRQFLAERAWRAGEPILVMAWEPSDSSPSGQVWIPRAGSPVVEGIFEQVLEGSVFVGARVSTLDKQIESEIEDASILLARAFQSLGYLGRCSFDFVVSSKGLRVIECNGRWGGTSTPMSLVGRVFGDVQPYFWSWRFRSPGLRRLGNIDGVLHGLGEHAFDRRTMKGEHLILSAYNVAEHGECELVTIAESDEHAAQLMNEARRALTRRT